MSSSYITITYHTISRVRLFYLFCWFDLHCILFYFILNWLDWIRFYSIRLNSILLNSIYYIVQYCISYQWMICVCLSICPSVSLSVCLSFCWSVCLFICMNKFLSLFSTLSFFFSFLFSLYSFLMNVFLTHTHVDGRGHTHIHGHTYIWIYVPSYDSYILLQKNVSEESYSSDSIISYLI